MKNGIELTEEQARELFGKHYREEISDGHWRQVALDKPNIDVVIKILKKEDYIKKSELEKAEYIFMRCQLNYSEKDEQVIKYVDSAIILIDELRKEISRLKDPK